MAKTSLRETSERIRKESIEVTDPLPETNEQITRWIAAHDARINELWRQQHTHNSEVNSRLTDVQQRLTALERRVLFMAGVSSAVGAFVGTAVAVAGLLMNGS